jgi:hypothetical protein
MDFAVWGVEVSAPTATQEKIAQVFDGMRELVLEKNRRYGDSALSPLGCFSKLSAEEAIRIRLDDKLKRISNSPAGEIRKNDVSDIIGYLALLCVSRGWTDFSDLLD